VKESTFNILSNRVLWKTTNVCDLFAGSGNLGLEALSRGARKVSFVEDDPLSIQILQKNIHALDVSAKCDVVAGRVEAFLQRTRKQYDLIFADPPYGYPDFSMLLDCIEERGLLSKNGLLVIEHSGKQQVSTSGYWTQSDLRSYGTTSISLLTLSLEI